VAHTAGTVVKNLAAWSGRKGAGRGAAQHPFFPMLSMDNLQRRTPMGMKI